VGVTSAMRAKAQMELAKVVSDKWSKEKGDVLDYLVESTIRPVGQEELEWRVREVMQAGDSSRARLVLELIAMKAKMEDIVEAIAMMGASKKIRGKQYANWTWQEIKESQDAKNDAARRTENTWTERSYVAMESEGVEDQEEMEENWDMRDPEVEEVEVNAVGAEEGVDVYLVDSGANRHIARTPGNLIGMESANARITGLTGAVNVQTAGNMVLRRGHQNVYLGRAFLVESAPCNIISTSQLEREGWTVESASCFRGKMELRFYEKNGLKYVDMRDPVTRPERVRVPTRSREFRGEASQANVGRVQEWRKVEGKRAVITAPKATKPEDLSRSSGNTFGVLSALAL